MTIGLLNWAAPSQLKGEVMQLQANLAASLLQLNNRNAVIMLNPQFAYRKGQLWVAEELCVKQLSSRPINLDKKFGLPFEGKADSRDGRSLLYDGRLLLAMGVNAHDHFLKDTPIFNGLVQPAKMLKSTKMIQVEDISDNALPQSTNSRETISAAERAAQVGEDAWAKMLDGVATNLNFSGRGALLILEMNFGVGHGFDAWIQKRKAWNFPSFYAAVVTEPKMAEWFQFVKSEDIKMQCLAGNFTYAGVPAINKEVPVELLEKQPELPKMNHLVATAPVSSEKPEEARLATLMLPQKLLDSWLKHTRHGDDFQAWVDAYTEEFGIFEPRHTVPLPSRRRSGGTAGLDC